LFDFAVNFNLTLSQNIAMKFNRHKFSKELDTDFFKTLRKRVDAYFEENKLAKQGNKRLILKTILNIAIFVTPYVLVISGVFTNPWLFLGLWAMMGLGMAGIGLNIMHDANHGAYSSSKKINKLMGLSINMLGGNANMWKMQHNVLHHTYTNIEGADYDLHGPSVLRFSPHQKKKWIHRFQHIYAWFFYGLMTLSWVTAKDFIAAVRYKKMGLIQNRKKFVSELTQIASWKAFYYSYILVIPILILPVSPFLILIGFVILHFVTGFIFGMIFQTAHVMPTSDFPLPNKDGMIENNWAIHQLATTSNYSPKSKLFSWFVGGLNFQIEHHLFTNISHVHYKSISKIVSKTAKEFGIPYHSQKNFIKAIWEHIKMLRYLGTTEFKPAVA
jgi:linoleoyl-CoA desaturase